MNKNPITKNYFISELYRLDSLDEELATDWIISNLDSLFLNGDFVLANQIISSIKIKILSSLSIVALLSITKHAEPHLPNRSRFVIVAEKALREKLSKAEVDMIMHGMK